MSFFVCVCHLIFVIPANPHEVSFFYFNCYSVAFSRLSSVNDLHRFALQINVFIAQTIF